MGTLMRLCFDCSSPELATKRKKQSMGLSHFSQSIDHSALVWVPTVVYGYSIFVRLVDFRPNTELSATSIAFIFYELCGHLDSLLFRQWDFDGFRTARTNCLV